ncbi:MAG: EAL domain-containing protein [Deltaproteobacteria bacterium]|nr:EAL domain-containing protein [Deltaproteobacteria bacterium]
MNEGLDTGSLVSRLAVGGEGWFRALAEMSTISILVLKDTFLYANPAAEALLGYSEEELRQLSPPDVVPPDFREKLGQRLKARLRGELVPTHYEMKVLCKNGLTRWVDYSASVIEHQGSKVVLACAFDITDRLLAQDALAREKELAQVTLAAIGDGVIRTDHRGRVDFLNPAASSILGWSRHEAIGLPVADIYPAIDESSRRRLPDEVAICLRQKKLISYPKTKLLTRRGDGAEFSVRDSVAPVRDRDGKVIGTVLVFRDVTQLRGMEKEMKFLESHDPLTGLVNRREFERRLQDGLEATREQGRHHALCFLDLDEFQLVNHSFGHTAGDEMLVAVADLLKSRVRKSDTVARLGSDEFGVLFQDCFPGLARSLCRSLLEGLKERQFSWGDRSFRCTASIGLVPVTAQMGAADDLLSIAHGACYLARGEGRNCIHEYSPGDTALAERHEEMQWIQRIHKAFKEDRFVLVSQTFEPSSPEAEPISEIFLRMVREDGELIRPAVFIQAAERYHLISTIDRWVVRTAMGLIQLEHEASVQRGDRKRTYTINLSGQSLSEEGFVQDVVGVLESSLVDPKTICFEITETATIANLQHATRFFSELRWQGYRFVLDDFGSGMSSLAYLKNLPVDFLKIDGQFVRNIAREPIQRAMVESIHRISRVLGIRTIGECVESKAALEVLREIGIDYAQGFWLSEPEPMV